MLLSLTFKLALRFKVLNLIERNLAKYFRTPNIFVKSYNSLHVSHWPMGVLSVRPHMRVYRLSPGGISKLRSTRHINFMHSFRLVAGNEMFYINNLVSRRCRKQVW